MFIKGTILQGRVEKLIFSGLGLIRLDSKVIFVEDVIAGELVEVEIVETKKSYAVAKLLRVLEKSPLRITPRCPHFGVCGGCQLQHIQYEAQVALKADWLQETLLRIGKITLDCEIKQVPATKDYEYRRKVLLHASIEGDDVHIGYRARDPKLLVDTQVCPIFVSEQNPIISDAKKILEKFRGVYSGSIAVHLMILEENRYYIRLVFENPLPSTAQSVLDECVREFSFHCISFQDLEKDMSSGSTICQIALDGMMFYCEQDTFLQNHADQSVKLYREIVSFAKKESKGLPVLDLYCGIGITSLQIAKEGIKCLGIESVPSAIFCAEKSRTKNALNNAEFITGKVEKVLPKLKKNTYGFIVLNPPRTGLSDVVRELLLKILPKTILYVSCMPSTLARDLKEFCEKGYAIEHVSCYDMFCQTTHLESLVVLKRKE